MQNFFRSNATTFLDKVRDDDYLYAKNSSQ